MNQILTSKLLFIERTSQQLSVISFFKISQGSRRDLLAPRRALQTVTIFPKTPRSRVAASPRRVARYTGHIIFLCNFAKNPNKTLGIIKQHQPTNYQPIPVLPDIIQPIPLDHNSNSHKFIHICQKCKSYKNNQFNPTIILNHGLTSRDSTTQFISTFVRKNIDFYSFFQNPT